MGRLTASLAVVLLLESGDPAAVHGQAPLGDPVPAVTAAPALPSPPCIEDTAPALASLRRVFDDLADLVHQTLPGPAGQALRQRDAERIAHRHVDVEAFTRMVLRGVWETLDEPLQDAWKRTLSALLRKRYVERIRDPRRHVLHIRSAVARCDRVIARVALEHTHRRKTANMEFSLHPVTGEWKVFDVSVEGIGLVSSLRSRLVRTLREEGAIGLDRQLRILARRYGVELGLAP